MQSSDEFSSWAETLQNKDACDETLRHIAHASGVNILLLRHLDEATLNATLRNRWGLPTIESLNLSQKTLHFNGSKWQKNNIYIVKCGGLSASNYAFVDFKSLHWRLPLYQLLLLLKTFPKSNHSWFYKPCLTFIEQTMASVSGCHLCLGRRMETGLVNQVKIRLRSALEEICFCPAVSNLRLSRNLFDHWLQILFLKTGFVSEITVNHQPCFLTAISVACS